MIASAGSRCAASAMAGAVFFAIGSTITCVPGWAAAWASTCVRWPTPVTTTGSAKRLTSAQRLSVVAQDARSRLELLNARLDEAVARAVELALRAEDATALSGLGGDVDDLVGEMESLRTALDEAGQASRGATATGTA